MSCMGNVTKSVKCLQSVGVFVVCHPCSLWGHVQVFPPDKNSSRIQKQGFPLLSNDKEISIRDTNQTNTLEDSHEYKVFLALTGCLQRIVTPNRTLCVTMATQYSLGFDPYPYIWVVDICKYKHIHTYCTCAHVQE